MNYTLILITVFVSYMILMLVVGYCAQRKTKTMADFLLANRTLGKWVTALSSVASSESGWAILGTTGLAYKEGLASFWFLPGCILGFLINWFLVAERLRLSSRKLQALTLPDYLEAYFNDSSHRIRILAVTIIFFSMMAYVAAQFTAIGKAFNAIFGISYYWSIIIGGVIVISYTIMGGFRAVSWTDFIQALLMVFALIILPIISVVKIGGIELLIQRCQDINPALLSPLGGKATLLALGTIVGLLAIGLGYPGQPHVITRYMAARNSKTIKEARFIAIIWGILIYSGAIILGLAGRILIPEIADSEYIFPKLALLLLPAILSGIMLSAVMAAIMSTADSQLLVASSSLVRDLYEKTFAKKINERKLLTLSRYAVLLLGILSLVLALSKTRVIFWFVLFAWSGLGASFGPLILFCLFSRKKISRSAAISGMLTGFLVTLLWKTLGLSEKIIYELVPAFLLSLIAIKVIDLKKKSNI